MIVVPLADGRQWLRVADAGWVDPLDPAWAKRYGGRWNPPDSFPVLYLNEDVHTARAQIRRLLEGQPVDPEDLDPPWVLVAAVLPRGQQVADAITDAGLRSLGLPASYPLDSRRRRVGHARCQPVGVAVAAAGVNGVHARSAATDDGSGRELAWFPSRPSSRARPVGEPVAFAGWWWG